MCFITLLLLVTLFLRLVLRFSTQRIEYAILLFLQLYLQPFQKKIFIYLSLKNSIFFFSHPHAHHDDTLSLRPHPQTYPPPFSHFAPALEKSGDETKGYHNVRQKDLPRYRRHPRRKRQLRGQNCWVHTVPHRPATRRRLHRPCPEGDGEKQGLLLALSNSVLLPHPAEVRKILLPKGHKAAIAWGDLFHEKTFFYFFFPILLFKLEMKNKLVLKNFSLNQLVRTTKMAKRRTRGHGHTTLFQPI